MTYILNFPSLDAARFASNAEYKRLYPGATTELAWSLGKIGQQFVCVVQQDTPGATETDATIEPAEPIVVPIEQTRANVVARIKAERDRRTQQGGFPAAGKWFHSDTFSRSQQLGLVLLGANIPPDLMWKTMDGSFILMTQTLANQIFANAAAQDAATFKRAEELQLFANNSPDPDGLVLSGWPPIFGE